MPLCADEFKLIKIVDTNTNLANSSEKFTGFEWAAIDRDQVVFVGSRSKGRQGLYIWSGFLKMVADTHTLMPGSTVKFSRFKYPSIHQRKIAFLGMGRKGYQGIYVYAGKLEKVADSNTTSPTRGGRFIAFKHPTIYDDNIIFNAYANTGSGIYTVTKTGLDLIADTQTVWPNGSQAIQLFGGQAALFKKNVAFFSFGDTPEKAGIIAYMDKLFVVADTSTPIPGSDDYFLSFSTRLSIEEQTIAFVGRGLSVNGIYLFKGGLQKVVDTQTPLPAEKGRFTDFESPLLSGDTLAFIGLDQSSKKGIYLKTNSQVSKVIATRDSLDGRQPVGLRLGLEGLDRGQIVFIADFFDGSQAIYTAETKIR
jgi:hypothetical protein